MDKKYNVAIIGAKGLVGQELIKILHTRRFPVNELSLITTKNSVGEKVEFGEVDLTIKSIEDIDCSIIDIIFNAAPSNDANEFLSHFRFARNLIIDKSGLLRMTTPLIVSGINTVELADILQQKRQSSAVLSMPNCCVIALILCLAPLVKAFSVSRIVISTYQSMSGAGRQALESLIEESFSILSYQPQLQTLSTAFNVIPVIGGGYDNQGNSNEECKVNQEIKKILGCRATISTTCVRVPVFIGHCASVNVEFTEDVQLDKIKEIFKLSYRCKLVNDTEVYDALSPRAVAGSDDVFISRLRQNQDDKKVIDFWVASDNLRIGAALNAVEVAEYIIYNELL
jgi:aspartate-semialdehyde dehydrogenase